MKKYPLPLAALAGGLIALALRTLQNRTGFEPDTGLPIPGAPAGLALALALIAIALVMIFLARKLPQESDPGPAFPENFSTENTLFLMLAVGGVALMAAAGALDMYGGIANLGLDAGLVTLLNPKAQLLMGGLALVSALSLLPAAAACRRREEPRSFDGRMLLVAPVCMVVRLVLAYRVDSMDPSLADYYIELLALVFLTLTFYRLSSFAFEAGRTRRFAFYAAAAAVLCMAALGDGRGVAAALQFLGGAMSAFGFLLLRLEGEDAAS